MRDGLELLAFCGGVYAFGWAFWQVVGLLFSVLGVIVRRVALELKGGLPS